MSTDAPQIGDLFLGRYEIESLLGQGGFASVFLARQVDLDRKVALKILKPGKLGDEPSMEAAARHENFAKRFEREAKLISRLRDPHTVVMHDYGRTEGNLLYMVLEYIDGASCSQVIKKTGRLAPARVVDILDQVLRSLREAHSMGVLHRDIKPQNIMLFEHMGDEDQVKVLDFGIAKPITSTTANGGPADTELTGTDGMLVGTPRYMSPEQIRADDLTPATDLYSLGLVAYELLLGEKAVQEPSTVRIISRHLSAAPISLPADLDVPPRLRAIIDQMLQKEVIDRYQTASEVLRDLPTWQDPVDITPALEPLPVEVEKSSGRSFGPATIALYAAIVGVVAGLTLWLLQKDDSGTAEAATGDPTMEVAEVPAGVFEDAGTGEASTAETAEVDPKAEADAGSASAEQKTRIAANDAPEEPAESPSDPEPESQREAPAAKAQPKPKPRPKPQPKPKPKPKPTFLPVE